MTIKVQAGTTGGEGTGCAEVRYGPKPLKTAALLDNPRDINRRGV